MAQEAELTNASVRIAESIHSYAKEKGWDREKYRVFITLNLNYDTIHILLVSDQINDDNKDDIMTEIMLRLRKDLANVPKVWRAYGIVSCSLDGFSFFADPRLSPGEVEVPDTILNPGVKDWRGAFRTYAR